MSVKTKSRVKRYSRIFGAIIFLMVFALNIQVITSDEIVNNDGTLSFAGVNVSVSSPIYGLPENPYGHYEASQRYHYFDGLGWANWFNCMAWGTPECTAGGWGFIN